MAKPLAVGMNRPGADGLAFAVHYGRPISTDGATATRFDERLPFTEGDQVRVFLRPEDVREHRSAAEILPLISEALPRRSGSLIRREESGEGGLRQRHLVLT